jgi:hypothetical protein
VAVIEKMGVSEADVTINGVVLTFEESMTLRVALESFVASGVTEPDGLGDDDVGRGIAEGYRVAVDGIRKAMYRGMP